MTNTPPNSDVYVVCFQAPGNGPYEYAINTVVHNHPTDDADSFNTLSEAESFAITLSAKNMSEVVSVHKFPSSHYPQGGDHLDRNRQPESIFFNGKRYIQG